MLITLLLMLHVLVAVALLGAVSHQAVSVLIPVSKPASRTFPARYAAVSATAFSSVVVWTYVASVILGGLIYPTYRLDVRIPLEDMGMVWAVGLFELKEHFGGIGLGALPLYSYYWRAQEATYASFGRKAITCSMAFIVWFDFIIGHILNNLRGL